MKKMNPDSMYWKYECNRSEKAKEYRRLWQLEHRDILNIYKLSKYYDRCILKDTEGILETEYDDQMYMIKLKERIEKDGKIQQIKY